MAGKKKSKRQTKKMIRSSSRKKTEPTASDVIIGAFRGSKVIKELNKSLDDAENKRLVSFDAKKALKEIGIERAAADFEAGRGTVRPAGKRPIKK